MQETKADFRFERLSGSLNAMCQSRCPENWSNKGWKWRRERWKVKCEWGGGFGGSKFDRLHLDRVASWRARSHPAAHPGKAAGQATSHIVSKKKSFLNPFFAGSICCSKLCQLNRAVPAGRYPIGSPPAPSFFIPFFGGWYLFGFSSDFPTFSLCIVTLRLRLPATCRLTRIRLHPFVLPLSLSFPSPLYCLPICALISIAAIFDYLILCAPHCCMHRLANTLELQPSWKIVGGVSLQRVTRSIEWKIPRSSLSH